MNELLAFDDSSYPLHVLLKTCLDDKLEARTTFLNQVPLYSLSIAAAREDFPLSDVAYLRAMDETQLAVVLPHISPQIFVERLQNLITTDEDGKEKEDVSYYQAAPFLRAATLEQKKAYFAQLKEKVPGPKDVNRLSFEQASKSLRLSLLNNAEYPDFTTEVEKFFAETGCELLLRFSGIIFHP